ncbi:BrnT family toxin [Candidatus Sumerlaeota bacterium]|nr:BrnT family toxin [Candidatus Sumerlaeota bacterium]
MEELRFEWDETKNKSNRRKHGVSFEEARFAFHDENAKVYFDPDHSEEEERFILLGRGFRPEILVVCRCYRERETVIRIISARRADKDEEAAYRSP